MIKTLSVAKFYLALFALVLLTTFVTSIYAQSPEPSSSSISKTQKRLNRIEEYYKKSAMFRDFKTESHQTAALKYYELTKAALEDGKKCRELEGDDRNKKFRCDQDITKDYMEVREFYRLLKWYQIEEGKPFVCVRAELGVGKELEARGISRPEIFENYLKTGKGSEENPKETGRTERNQVYLCTGEVGQKKLRVPTDNGRYVKLTPDELKREDLQISSLPPPTSLDTLEKQFGLR